MAFIDNSERETTCNDFSGVCCYCVTVVTVVTVVVAAVDAIAAESLLLLMSLRLGVAPCFLAE